MLHFIPAWYQQGKWCENEQSWYARRMQTEFDDTVKQIQLFHRSKAFPYQILLLSFTPNFRHFLHRQGVFHAPYWSCFDAIQGIRKRKPVVFSFHDLNWPDGIEFVYTLFVITAWLSGKKYAQIEFGEDGNPIRVELYQDGEISRRNIYDDRGFVSATVIYKEGKPLYEDYLTEDGIWKLRCFEADGHVQINPKQAEYLLWYQEKEQIKKFSRLTYGSIREVIYEVLVSYLSLTDEEDVFCAAMHERHAALLEEALKGKRKILSFFSDRYLVGKHPEAFEFVGQADYIVVDSKDHLEKIRMEKELSIGNMTDITPYDSRVDLGISQQLTVQKILVPVDGLDDAVFDEMIKVFGNYFSVNKDAQVHLFTRKADFGWDNELLERAGNALMQAGLTEGWARKEAAKNVAENDLEEEEHVLVKFFVEQCVSELEVSKCMREQRLIVDMREASDLYLQITAISMGIPQVARTETEFLENGKNGMVLDDLSKLQDVLAYYLDGLANWNRAMVCSYEIGKKYTTDKLVEKWKEVLDSIGKDSGTAVRK